MNRNGESTEKGLKGEGDRNGDQDKGVDIHRIVNDSNMLWSFFGVLRKGGVPCGAAARDARKRLKIY